MKGSFDRDASAWSSACGRRVHEYRHRRRDHAKRTTMSEYVSEVNESDFDQVVLKSKIWARTSTSMLLSRMPQRYCGEWAGPEGFSQQEPVVMPWGHWCPVLQPAVSSSWSVYRRTRCN